MYGDITITKMSEDMFNHKEENVTDGENVNEDILEMDETGIVRLDALQPVIEAVDLIQGSIRGYGSTPYVGMTRFFCFPHTLV